jgi:hypothetical protein
MHRCCFYPAFRSLLKIKLRHSSNQIKPLGGETGQYTPASAGRTWSGGNAVKSPESTAKPGKDIIPHRSIGWHRGGVHFVAMLCTAGIVLFASEARAQCTVRDVLRHQLALKKTPPANMPPIPVRSAVAVPVWKTITVTILPLQSRALDLCLNAVSRVILSGDRHSRGLGPYAHQPVYR